MDRDAFTSVLDRALADYRTALRQAWEAAGIRNGLESDCLAAAGTLAARDRALDAFNARAERNAFRPSRRPRRPKA